VLVRIEAAAGRGKDITLHEKGIVAEQDGAVGFFPYGAFATVREHAPFLRRRCFVFSATDGSEVRVPRIPEVERLMPLVRPRVGSAEHAGEIERPPGDRALSRYLSAGLILFFMISAAASLPVVLLFPNAPKEVSLTLSLGLVAPVLATYLFPVPIGLARRRAARMKLTRPFPGKPLAVAVLLCLALFAASGALAGTALLGLDDWDRNHVLRPLPQRLPSDTMDGFNETVRGYVVVASGATVRLSNGTIHFDSQLGPRTAGVYVDRGGRLELRNVTLRGAGLADTWTAHVYGTALVERSILDHPWGNKSRENHQGGFEIYSDDVTVRDSTILGGETNGLFVADSSPIIANNSFLGAPDDCLEIRQGSPLVEGNTFRACQWSITMSHYSRPEIRGNLFDHNARGVSFEFSSPAIRENVFDGSAVWAIGGDDLGRATISGNEFRGPGDKLVPLPAGAILGMCYISNGMVFAMGILLGLISWSRARTEVKRRLSPEKDEDPEGGSGDAPRKGTASAPGTKSARPPPAAAHPPHAPPAPLPLLTGCPRCRGVARLDPRAGRHFCADCKEFV
jgi:hypothetical protein